MSEPFAPYLRPLVHLPGTPLTPEVVLHRTMNELDRIASVIVVIVFKDNTIEVDRSRMKMETLAWASMTLTDEANRAMRPEA